MNIFKSVVKGIVALSPTFKKVATGIQIAESVTKVVSDVTANSGLTSNDLSSAKAVVTVAKTVDNVMTGTNISEYVTPGDTSYEHLKQVILTLTGLIISYKECKDDVAKGIMKSQINAIKRELAIIAISKMMDKGIPKIITYIEKWIGYVKK